MGQLAQAAQGRQLQAMNPAKQMKQLLEKSWPRIMAVMPREMSAQRLYQMYLSTINREKELANCTVESVLSCFMRCTSLGLEPSNVNGLGMAFILPFGNKNYQTGQKEATFILGYRGILELARRSGKIRDISARVVHEGDEFSYRYGLNEDLTHVPCYKPGKLTHVYMIANFKDGGHYFKVMSADEIKQAMQRSPSARKQNSPWYTDFEAMAMKTVIRRSAAFLPLSVESKTAISEDETTPDYSDVLQPLPDTSIDTEPAEPVNVSADDEPQPAPQEPESDPLQAKRERILDAFRTLGVSAETEVCETVAKIVGHPVQSLAQLTDTELDQITADLAAGTKKQEAE